MSRKQQEIRGDKLSRATEIIHIVSLIGGQDSRLAREAKVFPASSTPTASRGQRRPSRRRRDAQQLASAAAWRLLRLLDRAVPALVPSN